MDIKSKIYKIESLLSNETEFNEYINLIENTDIFVTEKIKYNLLDKIVIKKCNKISIYNIFKIVACMIFSLAIWRIVDIEIENINISNNNYDTQEIYVNLEDKFEKLSAFMMSPKVFEGGNK